MSRSRLSRWVATARQDPALVPRVVARKIRCGSGLGDGPPRTRRIGSVLFECDPALGEMARAMYCGLYEIRVIDAMRRLLEPGGVFVDVGANIGYHSAVAADVVGPSGTVYALEPVASHFDRLSRMARANPRHRIVTERAAAGEQAGEATIAIAGASNAGWNTLVPGHMPPERTERTERVPVVTLDAFLERHGAHSVSLIKIDVEGFELPVLRGLCGFLADAPEPPPILCEIAPRAYPLLGSSLEELEAEVCAAGYRAFDLRWPRRRVALADLVKIRDVLLMPAPRRAPARRAAVRSPAPATLGRTAPPRPGSGEGGGGTA